MVVFFPNLPSPSNLRLNGQSFKLIITLQIDINRFLGRVILYQKPTSRTFGILIKLRVPVKSIGNTMRKWWPGKY
ncbi:hypothetical protein FGO68_gene9325 [Halteria grandinella]|uniref:Uncharacterized protein n=1 Tax=Halteria grandinella TaxID=5974 RepID=A0A8J8T6T4_HALGN|nr:hypothetical protein FGO68_gene9325 [Halteria grandinella]